MRTARNISQNTMCNRARCNAVHVRKVTTLNLDVITSYPDWSVRGSFQSTPDECQDSSLRLSTITLKYPQARPRVWQVLPIPDLTFYLLLHFVNINKQPMSVRVRWTLTAHEQMNDFLKTMNEPWACAVQGRLTHTHSSPTSTQITTAFVRDVWVGHKYQSSSMWSRNERWW